MEKMARDADRDSVSTIESLGPKNKASENFIWDPSSKALCGRTASSWLKIAVFYVVFYLLLAGFWTVMLLVFYQTLDFRRPRWQLESSRITANPGLGFRPHPHPDNVDSTLIWFTHGSAGEWGYWVHSIEEYLTPYRAGRQYGEHVETCKVTDDKNRENKEPRVCTFDVDFTTRNSKYCTKANNFGFDVGRPCIILKLNRIFGWEPVPYTNLTLPSTMPDYLRNAYDDDYVYISCAGENPADKENIGPVRYYPENGRIPWFHFPFTNLDGYLSPLVFVHFERPRTGVLINIECKAWAANIKHDRADRLGSVHFELLVD